MRKLYILLFIMLVVSTGDSFAASGNKNIQTETVVSKNTPAFVLVQNLFRKIFTGKEQMSEKKRKRLARKTQ